jgi:predicted phosphodiesterase
MKLQILSDLHLESERFSPQPAPGAEVLVLAGDIDATWAALQRFAGWPVPVLMVAGNHEFDGRELDTAWPALRAACAAAGIRLLQREAVVLDDKAGRRVRFVGATRWSDFDLFGERGRAKAERAAGYFLQAAGMTRGGRPLDAAGVRAEAQGCRAFLEAELARPAQGRWDATVVVTHFAPSVRSADPRFGKQPGTASFCNADDDLIPRADLWIHGHLHCRHDYRIERPGRSPARVVCQARGLADKREIENHEPMKLFEV